ncbi:class F sortase [Streptomyces sp. SID4948]|uniref:class F sortase n=1 Tax=Streptomyces sp. SID4948 TaxID=2690287 RepID=UPI000B843C58|nr:class F sortase [Streptomyces sp. SID4948]
MSPAHPPVRRSRTRPAVACLALVVPAALVALTGCSAAPDAASAAVAPSPTSPPATSAPTAAGTPSPGASRTAPPAPPARVTIPSVGISSALMRLGLNADGTVEVPPADQGMTAGWYTGASVPGAAGAAVIIGHNDTRYGRAVFHDLRKIHQGADIIVTNTRGQTEHFTVTGKESVSKKSFPTQQVYGPTSLHALRLITCDGDFDANGHPVNNLIVFATLD